MIFLLDDSYSSLANSDTLPLRNEDIGVEERVYSKEGLNAPP